ncbi:hypothetical protein EJK15_49510 [Nonomuraea basaltis]|nr:hypothetical protein EJK15_49510 [Nonomuraea basaltis]
MTRICWGNVSSRGALAWSARARDGEGSCGSYPITGGELMARRARKGKARRKKKANHGKRPTAR